MNRRVQLFFASLCLLVSTLSAMSQQTASSDWESWLKTLPPVPEFAIPDATSDWQKQKAKTRKTLWKLLGQLPPRPKQPNVKTLSREDRGDFFVEKFVFDNGAGAEVPGYLLLPKTKRKKSPAILYCHWHGGQYDIGKEEMFQTNATPVAPGPELARNGFVVLAIDAYCFGERNGRGPGGPSEKGGAGEMTASKFHLWAGRSLWGMMLRDDLMALDYLASRPEVDARRIGVTGISMGATRTWWLMALDQRLKAGTAVCCLTRYQDLISIEGLKYHGIYYFVPGMLAHFDSEAVVSIIAPRPLLVMNGDRDAGSPVSGIRAIEKKCEAAYGLEGKPENFKSEIFPETGHVYLPAMWDQTLAWLKRHLQSSPK